MAGSQGKEQLLTIIAAFLIFVIFGAFILLIADPPDLVEMGGKRLCSSRVFDKFDCSDWLAENNNERSNSASSSGLWNGLFRELMPAVTQSTDDCIINLSVLTVKADGFPNIKNSIQIKLRI